MADEKLWDYDVPGNSNQINGPSGSSHNLGSCNSESDFQAPDLQPNSKMNFTSLFDEFERKYGVVENHGSFSEGVSLNYIPELVKEDVMMKEEADPYPSIVYQIASLPDEAFLEFMMAPSTVHVKSEETAENPGQGEARDVVDDRGPVDVPQRDNGPKPRFSWTPQLHERFVHIVALLGGCDSATPKVILGLMNVPNLSRYHVRTHLEKYRKGEC